MHAASLLRACAVLCALAAAGAALPVSCTSDETLAASNGVLFCAPVDCLAKYGAARSFFNTATHLCAAASPTPSPSTGASPGAGAGAGNSSGGGALCVHGVRVCSASTCACACDSGWTTAQAGPFAAVNCNVSTSTLSSPPGGGGGGALACSSAVTCFFANELPYALAILAAILGIALAVAYCMHRACCPACRFWRYACCVPLWRWCCCGACAARLACAACGCNARGAAAARARKKLMRAGAGGSGAGTSAGLHPGLAGAILALLEATHGTSGGGESKEMPPPIAAATPQRLLLRSHPHSRVRDVLSNGAARGALATAPPRAGAGADTTNNPLWRRLHVEGGGAGSAARSAVRGDEESAPSARRRTAHGVASTAALSLTAGAASSRPAIRRGSLLAALRELMLTAAPGGGGAAALPPTAPPAIATPHRARGEWLAGLRTRLVHAAAAATSRHGAAADAAGGGPVSRTVRGADARLRLDASALREPAAEPRSSLGSQRTLRASEAELRAQALLAGAARARE